MMLFQLHMSYMILKGSQYWVRIWKELILTYRSFMIISSSYLIQYALWSWN